MDLKHLILETLDSRFIKVEVIEVEVSTLCSIHSILRGRIFTAFYASNDFSHFWRVQGEFRAGGASDAPLCAFAALLPRSSPQKPLLFNAFHLSRALTEAIDILQATTKQHRAQLFNGHC